jgi:hypothetical protein
MMRHRQSQREFNAVYLKRVFSGYELGVIVHLDILVMKMARNRNRLTGGNYD